MSNNRFVFYDPDSDAEFKKNIFGCSSHGFSTETQCVSPNERSYAVWDHELPGKICSGTYQSVLYDLSLLSFTPEICIVLYKKAAGFEDFLNQAVKIYPNASIIGGGASFTGDMQEGKLLPEAKDVGILAVSTKNFRVEKLNIFDDLNIQLKIESVSKRSFSKIRELPDGKWQNAVSYYREKQVEYGIDLNNFENLCFCDKNGRNLHCSISDENIFSGANLPEDNLLFMKYVSSEKADERLSDFINDTDSLIFDCAGIRSLINKPIYTGKRTMVGFMFGEIIACDKQAELGNLMLTKLKVL